MDDVFQALSELCPPSVAPAIRRLGEDLASHGGYWQTGAAAYPTMSAYLQIGPELSRRSVVAVYADPSGPTAPRISVNFGSLTKDLSDAELGAVLEALEGSEPIRPHLQKVRSDGFNTYPTIPLVSFVEGNGHDVLMEALRGHLRPADTD